MARPLRTVIATLADEAPPLPSFTVSVMVLLPTPRIIVGVGPVAVPNGPVQEYVSGSPSGSLDPVPFSVIRAIFRLAAQDRLLPSNPAEMLFTPRTVAAPSRRVLTPEQVQLILQVLPVREQLIVRLALFSGMRPGEIFALQWKHIADDHVEVVHRIYRG